MSQILVKVNGCVLEIEYTWEKGFPGTLETPPEEPGIILDKISLIEGTLVDLLDGTPFEEEIVEQCFHDVEAASTDPDDDFDPDTGFDRPEAPHS